MPLTRFSVSLDQDLVQQFDAKIAAEKCPTRSKAVGDLIRSSIVEPNGSKAMKSQAPSPWSMTTTVAT